MRFLDPEKLRTRVEDRLMEDIAEGNVFGAAIYVQQEDRVIYNQGIGTANPTSQMPITDRTIFRLASMTKPITAVAAMILVERGLLHLDDPIEMYLPSFSRLHLATVDSGELIDLGFTPLKPTVRNILSHTSGIGSGITGIAQIRNMTEAEKATLSASVSYFSRQGLSFEPGNKQEYSGFPSFDVLAAVIETTAGQSLGTFLQEEIFDKCDMPDTTFVTNTEQRMRLAVMHDRVMGRSVVAPMLDGCIFEDIPCSHPLAGAGLVSTLADYSHFAQMLLSEGMYNGERILSAKSVVEISTPQVSGQIQPGLYQWGLGVRVIVDSEYKYLPVGTYGWSGVYGPHFWIDPQNKIAAVYMKNSRHDPGAGSVTGYNFEQDVYESLK